MDQPVAYGVRYCRFSYEVMPGSKDIKQPKPKDIRCRYCEKEIEIWSDETEVKCKFCGKINLHSIGPTYLDWGVFAKECVGEEKYRRIKASAGSKN